MSCNSPNFYAVGVFEIAEHESVRKPGSYHEGERTPDTYWIVSKPEFVRMKQLLLYEDLPVHLSARAWNFAAAAFFFAVGVYAARRGGW